MQGLVVGPQGSDGEDVGVREWDVEEVTEGKTVSGSGSSEPRFSWLFASGTLRSARSWTSHSGQAGDKGRWFGCQNKNEPSMLEDPGTPRSLVGLQQSCRRIGSPSVDLWPHRPSRMFPSTARQ